jgi:hypothetical protein
MKLAEDKCDGLQPFFATSGLGSYKVLQNDHSSAGVLQGIRDEDAIRQRGRQEFPHSSLGLAAGRPKCGWVKWNQG